MGGYIQYCRKRHTARKGKKGPSLVGKSGFSEGVGAEKSEGGIRVTSML